MFEPGYASPASIHQIPVPAPISRISRGFFKGCKEQLLVQCDGNGIVIELEAALLFFVIRERILMRNYGRSMEGSAIVLLIRQYARRKGDSG